MGLFVEQPKASPSAPMYTLGLSKTIIIVGLGNPGKEYTLTRHNVGFVCVEALAEALKFPGWTLKKDLFAEVTSHTIGHMRVILVKPTTFMNDSGKTVHAGQHFYKVATSQTAVVHDELDIPFGQIRTRNGGGDAGHNGIKSIITHCGDNFGRVRVGIANDISAQADSTDFVLGKFTKTEQAKLDALTAETTSILTELIYRDGVLNPETRSFII
jgi:PTH1 family peptidyl-tRNA hydrolase